MSLQKLLQLARLMIHGHAEGRERDQLEHEQVMLIFSCHAKINNGRTEIHENRVKIVKGHERRDQQCSEDGPKPPPSPPTPVGRNFFCCFS